MFLFLHVLSWLFTLAWSEFQFVKKVVQCMFFHVCYNTHNENSDKKAQYGIIVGSNFSVRKIERSLL